MIERVWRTGLKPGRGQAYEEFARAISLPMFRRQPGFLGCIMSRSEEEGSVTTLWRDVEAVEALAGSESYQMTVAEILAADLLAGEQSTEIRDVHLCTFDRGIGLIR